ncbi:hypothetical protein [Bradyrhizobium sp. MOS002]|uniref:hypothetical protein n=1 Tax=Bradyrhizobium sp. MOS002 TaxID=2133947 RepID=UPI000D12E95E|nr:hypothetical protein [Bradyrhizobium sp. MOS002]PSO23143.1 hypothetical protein C7G41_33070 [Bradyrhizobium sp. MOS002]
MRFRKQGQPFKSVTARNTGISHSDQGRYPLRGGDPWMRTQIREARERVRRPVSQKWTWPPAQPDVSEAGQSGVDTDQTMPSNG